MGVTTRRSCQRDCRQTIVNLVREQVEREDMSVQIVTPGCPGQPSSCVMHSSANKIIYQTADTAQCEVWAHGRCCMFFDNRNDCAVGDSGCTQRSDKLEQSRWTLLLQELVDRGFYSRRKPSALQTRTTSHVRCARAERDVEIQEVPVQKGDATCSAPTALDMVEDEDIHLTINTLVIIWIRCQAVDSLANDNGGGTMSRRDGDCLDAFPARTRIFDKILGWFG